MKNWPKSCQACINCGCVRSRRGYGGRGYCCRCYRLILRLDEVKGWNRNHPAVFKHLLSACDVTDKEIEISQAECIRQIEGHLHRLQGREEKFQGDVSGLDIEHQLGRVLRLIRPKDEYPRLATYISNEFTKKQLGRIYRLLDYIEEQVPWEGPGRYRTIQFKKAWEKILEHREQTNRLPENLL